MTSLTKAAPAAAIYRLIQDTPERFNLGHARALVKMSSAASLVAMLNYVRPLLEPAELIQVAKEQMLRLDQPAVDLDGWLDIMRAATDDDIWDAMCTEEKLIHADLDEDLELYAGPVRFGGVMTWYLSKDEALVALPGQRNVATCRAERRRCLLQLCPTGVFVIPLGSEA